MIFARWRRRRASAGVQAARDEAERSRQRLDHVRSQVVEPLREAARRNQFADMLRRAVAEGYSTGETEP